MLNSPKTLLIALYPYKGQGLDSWIDHGAGMTYTAAKNAGCDIDFLDMKALHNDEELQASLRGYDLIAISMKSSYYPIGMKVVNFAKAQSSKVIIGGYHATAAPQELIENKDIDYIFQGESEITFPKFLKDCSNFERSITGEKPQDLDKLPFINRSIYRDPLENCEGWWYGGKKRKMTTVIAARGCPYQCAFCQPLEDNHFGKKLRRRSPRNLIDELDMLKKMYNPECVMIHDDTFFLDMKWLQEFAEQYYNHIRLPFWASARADGICEHPDMVEKLVKVGWELISVGFESGSQRILDKLKKGTTVEQNLESARIIKSTGAKIYANYITGIPWETKWDIQATAQMADIIAAEMPSWAYFAPYPGCELGEECINRGWSLLNRETYSRSPQGVKVKHVDYDYISKVRKGLREETYPEFCDIVIPSYNNEHYTIGCLESIKKYTTPGTYRVIWVDNASKNSHEVDEVISDMEHLSIKLSTNEGFVGATNVGLEASNAPNVCLLNNDTEVSEDWLAKLVSTLRADDKLGIVGALTNYGKGIGMDSHHSLSLHSTLLPSKAILWDLGKINERIEKNFSGRTYTVPFVAFLCAVIRREVIDKVGHLDPNYAMGMWDDLDYNRSVRKAGFETKLAIDTCIQHYGRSTFKVIQSEESFNVDRLLRTNRAYLDKKWGKFYGTKEVEPGLDPNRPFIISRAIYNRIGEKVDIGVLTEERLDLMQRYFIRSLDNQTDMDYILYLVVGNYQNEATERIEGLDWGNITVQFIYTSGDVFEWKQSIADSKNWGQENDPGSPEYIARKSRHPQSNIMARMDTDDWVAPGWIAHMKYMANIKPESHFLINYQVTGQSKDGRLYKFFADHTHSRTSPFIALVQKRAPRISPYEDSHLKMGSKFATVYTMPPSYVFMVLHEGNRSNRVYQFDKYFEDIEDTKHQEKLVPKKVERKKLHKQSVRGTDWKSRIAQASA